MTTLDHVADVETVARPADARAAINYLIGAASIRAIETTLLSIPSYKIRNQPPTIGILAKLDARGESAVGIVVFHLSKSYLGGDHLVVGKILLAEPV